MISGSFHENIIPPITKSRNAVIKSSGISSSTHNIFGVGFTMIHIGKPFCEDFSVSEFSSRVI